jgi:hypothetical protein
LTTATTITLDTHWLCTLVAALLFFGTML